MNRMSILLSLMVLCFSMNAFAVCEKERAERDEWKNRFEKSKGTTNLLGGAIGGAIGFLCGGPPGAAVGGLVLGGAGYVPTCNFERIYLEKEKNLSDCLDREARLEKIKADNEARDQAALVRIHKETDDMRKAAIEYFDNELEEFTQDFIDEGYDINQPHIQREIADKAATLQADLQRYLTELEDYRKKRVEGYHDGHDIGLIYRPFD